jgi:formylglycine-generating enzyme required for sulfatase activity
MAPFDAARAKQHPEAWATYLGVPVEMTNSIGMRFLLIPPGEFDMGSTEGVARGVSSANGGRVRVRLPSGDHDDMVFG